MQNACEFSACRRYRYTLAHTFERDLFEPESQTDKIVWLMLNPSTADESQLDPTLRRVAAFSRGWGYPGFIVLNLFAYRSTEPEGMKAERDPVGPRNDSAILETARNRRVICGWGNHGTHRDRDLTVFRMLHAEGIRLECLSRTGIGMPQHPLYMPGNAKPFEYLGRSGCEKSSK